MFIRWKLRCDWKPLSSAGPASYPVIGCLVSFYKNRHRLLDWYTGMLSVSPTQTFVISRFGARRTIVTSNPRNVEYILKRNFSNYPKGKPFTETLEDFLGKGIFNVDGDLWYNQRKIVAHEFSAQSIRYYSENLLKEEVEKKLIPVLESAADNVDNMGVVDLQDLFRRLAFDLVCKVSLGFDPCCLDECSLEAPHPIMEAFDVASEVCAGRGAAPLSASWKVKRLFAIGSEKRLKEAMGRIHSFIADVIHDKKTKNSSGDDFLSKMVADGEEEGFMRDTIISFIMAGRDTTSAAMTWLFYLVSRHPDVEDRLVREVEFIKKDKELSKYETLKELKLLKACISESMRLFPPVAWDSKHAIADDLLPDGTQIRTGDRVTYFPYGMGRMASLWGEDRLDFKPERWISETEGGRVQALKNISPYIYPVFQAGPRACPGREMAFVQMKYVVASIVTRFRIRPTSMVPPVFVPLLTAHMAGGFNVFVCRRH
ncbi:hypothetical protein F511_25523 [Dorcoceras hygrometricum]|uniref:Cytochrome P450 94B3-like n=1 Tax=Dorcoceras hygrometricum TaxID=472368 RepID=A0A2Z7AMB6_9LAMI|nr:hypothetical protein F511_25523 [Dorcoceras hygrometricum]